MSRNIDSNIPKKKRPNPNSPKQTLPKSRVLESNNATKKKKKRTNAQNNTPKMNPTNFNMPKMKPTKISNTPKMNSTNFNTPKMNPTNLRNNLSKKGKLYVPLELQLYVENIDSTAFNENDLKNLIVKKFAGEKVELDVIFMGNIARLDFYPSSERFISKLLEMNSQKQIYCKNVPLIIRPPKERAPYVPKEQSKRNDGNVNRRGRGKNVPFERAGKNVGFNKRKKKGDKDNSNWNKNNGNMRVGNGGFGGNKKKQKKKKKSFMNIRKKKKKNNMKIKEILYKKNF